MRGGSLEPLGFGSQSQGRPLCSKSAPVYLREADCSLPAYEAGSINSGPQAWAPSLGEGDRSAATPISCQRPTPKAAQGVWICSGLHRDLFIQVQGAEHQGAGVSGRVQLLWAWHGGPRVPSQHLAG